MASITEVEIIPVKPSNGLVAFASLVLNGELYLGSIGVHTRLNGQGYRLTYPTKLVSGGSLNIYHPIKKSLSEEIETAVFKRIEELEKLGAAYD